MRETWLVTGSSVGLGRSIVEAALAEGHNVVATTRHPRTLDDLASQFPDQLLAQRLEVTDGRNARDVVEATIERFGRLDVLVNNAGFAGAGSIENMPLDLIEQQFDTNFMGAIHACKAALPTMRAQRQGRIILISSIGARIATPGAGIYYASIRPPSRRWPRLWHWKLPRWVSRSQQLNPARCERGSPKLRP